ncbi:MAG TPA: GxxExxY protein [Isosphaeraceae bacterium]|jgi:GxxExxY protein|nr:GxxExxY protein [Isosphaeraceae bacterium]
MDAKDGDAQTYAIIGAAMEVHRRLGRGFLENVYQEALAVEFQERDVPFVREAELPVHYKGRALNCSYRADFVCFEAIIVELKAIAELTTREHAQVLNYLKATRLGRGLLFNFGAPRLEYKRFIFSDHPHSSASSADNSSPENSGG